MYYLPLGGNNISHSLRNGSGRRIIECARGALARWSCAGKGTHRPSAGFNDRTIVPLFKHCGAAFVSSPVLVLLPSGGRVNYLQRCSHSWTVHSFWLDCIDKSFLSSQGKCHDQYSGIGSHYRNNPHMWKWEDGLKEGAIAATLSGKCIFEGWVVNADKCGKLCLWRDVSPFQSFNRLYIMFLLMYPRLFLVLKQPCPHGCFIGSLSNLYHSYFVICWVLSLYKAART